MTRVSLRSKTAFLIFFHDVTMAAGAFLLAYVLRLGDNLALFPMDLVLTNTILFTAIAAIVYQVTGLYRTMWRYTSVSDLLLIGKVTGITILIYYPTSFVITRLEGVPRSLFFIDALMLVLMLGAPRIAFRLLKEGRFTARPAIAETREQVLLVGGGDEVEAFIRATRREVHCPYEVIGIIDTLSERVGYQIHGVPVVGSVEDNLSTLIAKFTGPPLHVRRMIATNDLKGSLVRHLVDLAAQQSMTLSRLPSIMELRAGNRFELRPIDIADLLNRPQANLDIDGMRNLIQGKRVLVTGAGGSIGSELVRQVASFGTNLNLVAAGELDALCDARDPAAAGVVSGDLRTPPTSSCSAIEPLAETSPAWGRR